MADNLHEEQDKDFSEFDKYYQNLDIECINCNSKENVIKCIYGMPTMKLYNYSKTGKVKLMGCGIEPGHKFIKAYCNKCDLNIY